MVIIDEMKLVQSYEICESKTIIEDALFCEYGILQSSIDDNNQTVVVLIEKISTDKKIVETLIERMAFELIDPITLQDIVEDYLGEISSI